MSRNDARDFAERLYARVPAHYRVYDAERGQPLLALLIVVGEQVSNVRQDLDALWDNFFIETCDVWVVPYIGALVGTNLLQQPVGQSNRLDVWNTVIWRRSKGTPQMLDALAQSISGWPSDLAECFQSLGWSQNMNHVRLDRPLTPSLRDPRQLRLLGRAADPFGHAADFRPPRLMDQSRIMPHSQGMGISAFGTPGRYQIKNLGFFVRRLHPFAVRNGSPASALPGGTAPAGSSLFTFNPLFRDAPLFEADSGTEVTRADFAAAPWKFFGDQSSIAVRQSGVLLASEIIPQVPESQPSQTPFTLGGAASAIALDQSTGLRLLAPHAFQLGSARFLITAQWRKANGATTNLGVVDTLAASGNRPSFTPGATANGAGQLAISLQTGQGGAPPRRFPGSVIAVRAARTGALHTSDALYVYLPPTFLKPGKVVQYFVADDGSTYTDPSLATSKLARVSEGQVYPPRAVSTSTDAAGSFTLLNRQPSGMALLDRARFSGAQVLVQADLFTSQSTFQTLGAIATVNQTGASFPGLRIPAATWPAFTYAPSVAAIGGALPSTGVLSILLRPLAGNFIPASELVIVNRAGRSLLVYLPEVPNAAAAGVRVVVADDGSTWFAPTDSVQQTVVLQQQAFSGLTLARSSLGQSMPIPGIWPLQHRIPVAANLCHSERASLLNLGELGIDPELGRFALPPADPALAQGNLTVDYVEAFSAAIGANSEREPASTKLATRLVSRLGDASSALTQSLDGAPIHTTLSAALAAAQDADVIEIVDSATYNSPAPIVLNKAAVKNLTIRATSGQRPCVTSYSAANTPSSASLVVTAAMDSLSIDGLLWSGGAIFIESRVTQLTLTSCTLDPESGPPPALVSTDTAPGSGAAWLISRSICGGLRAGPGVAQLTVTDTIVDAKRGIAIAGLSGLTSPPIVLRQQADTSAKVVQLERATVFGSIFCEVMRASECLLNDVAIVQDQQSGCVRFTRFETGSVLPRRYQCLPDETQPASCKKKVRCLAPAFTSRRFGRPGYAQLGFTCPGEVLTASESGAEVGAFAGNQDTIRLRNLTTKLQEFMPVGLTAVITAET